MPPWCGLRVSTKRGQTVELLHDLFQFVFSFLQVKVASNHRIFTSELDYLLPVEVVQKP
jgi:hypothetical protein